MIDPRPDLAKITFGVLSIVLLIGSSLWILRPFLGATIWAVMVVVATWPALLWFEARLWRRRSLAVLVMVLILLLLLVLLAKQSFPQQILNAYVKEGLDSNLTIRQQNFDLEKAKLDDMPEHLRNAFLEIKKDSAALLTMFNKDVRRMVQFKDWNDNDLASIKAPTLLVLGDKDVVTTEHAVEMNRKIRDSELLVLPGNFFTSLMLFINAISPVGNKSVLCSDIIRNTSAVQSPIPFNFLSSVLTWWSVKCLSAFKENPL